ncbi:MAG: glycoside hydrolase family 95 protein [Sphingobium sp.]|nr:glycoside hydrolase family 95 protein [Sphingobium sp.]
MRFTRRAMLGGSAGVVAGFALPQRAAGQGAAASPERLWYRQPAAQWVEALPIGNGRLGAMVFGGAAHECLQLNEDTLWAGGPYDPVNPAAKGAIGEVRRLIFSGRYVEAQKLANEALMARPLGQMSYQTAGDLLIDMAGFGDAPVEDYHRELDLDAALATTRFRAGGVAYRRRAVASPAQQIIAVHLDSDRLGAVNCDIALTSPHHGALSVENDMLVFSGSNPAENGIAGALRFEMRVRLLAKGGSITRGPKGIAVRGADALTLHVAIATSFRRFDNVGGDPTRATKNAIDRAANLSFDRIAADTARDHQRLFRRAALDLGHTPAADRPTDERIRVSQTSDDPALAALYFQYGRYLLICCSRPGTQPANLQGLWNDSTKPPWGSKYTININTEMNYWPAEPTGLAECTVPLVAMVRELAITGAHTAREIYGARGWVAHHNTDIWRATAPIDGAQWGLWPMGGAWLCTHLWTRYDYGRDKAFLRAVYPLMRGAAQFFLDVLQTDPRTGFLVTNPSISPENTHPGGASVCAGPAMDMQILRDLFDQTARAAAILGTDPQFANELAAARAKLAPDKIGAQGQLQEWQEDWDAQAPDPHHRHVSHLYALFPSQQIDPDMTPALAAAARKSLETRGDESTGWATAWRAALWARLRDGDHAHAILRFLMGSERTYPNMFDAHPPFQIDGNFGGAAAIAEMLMQSRDEEVFLLPALPRAWPNGAVRGLCARGACQIDIEWRDNQLVRATLAAAVRGKKRVRCGNRSIELVLAPGATVTLHGPMLERGPA